VVKVAGGEAATQLPSCAVGINLAAASGVIMMSFKLLQAATYGATAAGKVSAAAEGADTGVAAAAAAAAVYDGTGAAAGGAAASTAQVAAATTCDLLLSLAVTGRCLLLWQQPVAEHNAYTLFRHNTP
jgi:hypothetical protein